MQSKTKKRLVFSGIIAGCLFLLLFGSMEYTSRSEFCNTCHYMEPFYIAWKNSTHRDVDCITCHYAPGIASTFEGKIKGLEQLFKYATQSYRRSKPWAEIPDASCLRGGCHDERLLEGKVKFKEEIIFDHSPHLRELRRGKKLRCTSCHSQIVQGEHITVTETTCFLCHFKGLDAEASPSCTSCHHAPVQAAGRQVRYDHTQIVQREIACNKCHGEMVMGDGAVPQENCEDCHFQKDRLDHFDNTELIHRTHITEHKIECQRCHLPIQHKSVSRSRAVKPDCRSCHLDYHQAQEMLFFGTGGRDVANHPSPMFESGLNCQACHIFHQSFENFQPAGETYVARGESCEPCHGTGYGDLLAAWRDSTDRRLKAISKSIRRVELELRGADSTSSAGREAFEAFSDAQFNYRLVEYGKSVHNITYADNLLQAAQRRLEHALKAVGSSYRLASYPWSAQLVPSECANCHKDIDDKAVEAFGLQFDHGRHLKSEKLDCRNCHSNMRRHGEMTMTRNDCLSCHHEPDRVETRENCLPCHQTQFSVYSGTALGAEISDVMFDSGVDCRGCHLDQSGQITRPGPKTCLNCHEEGYDEMLSEWQFNTTAMIQEIESLLARLETAGPGQPDKKILSTARTALDLFTRDGSKGAHNNLLAEEYLGEVLDNLKKLMPSS